MSAAFLEQLRLLAEEVIAGEGCSLYDIEFLGSGGNRILRVYIDKAGAVDNPEAGVSIEDCSNVSRALNLRLDVEDIVPGGAYHLEVSSPGLERVLRHKWHYERAIGRRLHVRTFASLLELNPDLPTLGKAKQVVGELVKVEGDDIFVKSVLMDKSEAIVRVPLEQITKAHLVFEIAVSAETMKKRGKNGR